MKNLLRIAREINRFFSRKLLRKLSGAKFCALYNARSWVLGWLQKIKVSYAPDSKIYYAADEKTRIAFNQPVLADRLYWKGVQHRLEYLEEVYFLPCINFAKGDLVVDCGANIGELLFCFQRKNIPIDYIGIEPAPLEYECLKENAKHHTVHNLGLWKDDGHLDFYISSVGADSSFIRPKSPVDGVVQVPATRLETLLPDKKIKLLKLEAEGAELEVLMGCERILGNIEYISADLGPERGLNEEMTLIPVINHLVSAGFDLVQMRQKRIICLFKNRRSPNDAQT